MNIFPKKIRDRLEVLRANPKGWAKFNLQIVRYAMYGLCLLIGWQFIKAIIGFNSGSTTFNMIGRILTILIMLWVFYTVYKKAYVPMRDRFEHYANMKSQEMQVKVDVNKLVTDTLNDFDKEKVKGGLKQNVL